MMLGEESAAAGSPPVMLPSSSTPCIYCTAAIPNSNSDDEHPMRFQEETHMQVDAK